jgi:hypothetical protein
MITFIAVGMFLIVVGAMLSVFSEPKPAQRHTPDIPEPNVVPER